jgi:hypothetical protein
VVLVALEQPGTHLLFERLDLNAQGRLRHVQLGGGFAEAELIRHSDEEAQLLEFHNRDSL